MEMATTGCCHLSNTHFLTQFIFEPMKMADQQKFPEKSWEAIIEESFFVGWQERSTIDITDNLYMIKEHFDLCNIALELKHREKHNPDRQRLLTQIQLLTKAFSEALLQTSDDGKVITHRTIIRAKDMIRPLAGCDL
jgi:hypothetical protein